MLFQNHDLIAFLSIFYVFSRTDLGELTYDNFVLLLELKYY